MSSAMPRVLVALIAIALAVFFLMGQESDSEYDPSLVGEFGVVRAPGLGDPAGDPSLHAGGRLKPDPKVQEAERAAREAEARNALRADGVYGVVTDARAKPIAGATVSLIPDPLAHRYQPHMPDGPAMATAQSLADGSFVVGPMPADGRAKLRAEAPGYAPTVASVRAKGGRVDLILDLGGSLKVRVIDQQSEPVVGVTIIHQAGTVISEATTDEAGQTAYANLPTGTGNLVVFKRGHGAVRDGDVSVAPGETEQRTYVLGAATKLQGKVQTTDDSMPIRGARVWLKYPQLPGLGESEAVISDEQGAFELLLEASGQEQFVVHATKEGMGEGRAWLNAAHRGEVVVQLQGESPPVEGRVLAAEGGAAHGAQVTYAFVPQEQNVPSVRTDEGGRFLLPPMAFSSPGTSWTVIAVAADGSMGTAQVQVPKKDDAHPPPVEIRLSSSGNVRGKVTGQAGEPIGGALVELQPDWSGGGRGLQQSDWMLLRIVQDQSYHTLTAVTNTEGLFTLSGVPAVAYKISAQWGLTRAQREEAVVVAPGRDVEVEIALGEAGTIEGYVVDGEERPIAGAYVYGNLEQQGNQGWWGGNLSARSQSDGRYVLRGIAYGSRYTLYANASGYSGANQKGVAQGDREITLRLIRRGWIEGTVYKEGSPHRGTFTITAMPKQADEKNSRFQGWREGQQQNTFNTDDGKFTLKGFQAGEYTVQAQTPEGMIAVQRDVVRVMDGRPSTPARLDLQPGARLFGRVTKGATGQPLANAWVYLNAQAGGSQDNSGATSGYGNADAQGNYEIKGLGAGSYLLTVWSPNGSNWTQSVDLDAGVAKELDLREQDPGSVIVMVIDENEQPLEGVRVHIRSESGQYIGVNIQAMQKDGLVGQTYNWQELYNTNSQGRLTRWHLPPGRHEVWATKNGYDRLPEKLFIDIQSGMQTSITVPLKSK